MNYLLIALFVLILFFTIGSIIGASSIDSILGKVIFSLLSIFFGFILIGLIYSMFTDWRKSSNVSTSSDEYNSDDSDE